MTRLQTEGRLVVDNAHRVGNVDGRHLVLFGEAKVAVGVQLLGAEGAVGVLGAQHHGRPLLAGRLGARRAPQTLLVEPDAGYVHRIVRTRL